MAQMSNFLGVINFLGKNASMQRTLVRLLVNQNSFKGHTESIQNVSRHNMRIISSKSFFLNTGKLPMTKINEKLTTKINGTPTAKINEKPTPKDDMHKFQADTRQLLDVVARSLYSEKEIFVRELISNASDALENFRYMVKNSPEQTRNFLHLNRPLEIRLFTDKVNRKFTIQDTGIGMTRTELVRNLGTIASSGSKQFLENIKDMGNTVDNLNIIGQFGVGFYSVFMVANKIEVLTRSSDKASKGYRWYADGSDHYDIQEIEDLSIGTKIILHLKPECMEYADDKRIKDIINKYSCFIRSPIYLNGELINNIKPLWLKCPKDVLVSEYTDFYRYITQTSETPIYTFHFLSDVPQSIRALIYFPKAEPSSIDDKLKDEVGVALYARKILIQSSTKNLLPKWLRFVKGVVDSEDIPLNLSREILQNSDLIKKLQENITRRIIRFLQECAKRDTVKYLKFYNDFGMYLREGVVAKSGDKDKEEIAKLLRFDCSTANGKVCNTSLEDYCNMVGEKNTNIYYLIAKDRLMAESSPSYEYFKSRNIPVLFCYHPYDELVLLNLKNFNNKNILPAEKSVTLNKLNSPNKVDFGVNALKIPEVDNLTKWISNVLKDKVASVKATTRLESHPCVITVKDMAEARLLMYAQSNSQDPDKNRWAMLQTTLEINPKHDIIKKLFHLIGKDDRLARLIVEQLFTNSMVAAGLTEDPRIMMTTMNNLLLKFLESQ